MYNKTLAIVAYITIIGWVVAYFQYRNEQGKDKLVRYHLEQALGVFIFAIVLGIAVGIISAIIPSLATLLSVVTLLPLILLIFGIITASNEACKPVPVIGQVFENRFAFLN